MAKKRMTVTEAINRLGGYGTLSKEIGLDRTAVYRWWKNNRLPSRNTVELAKYLAKRVGCTPEELLGL